MHDFLFFFTSILIYQFITKKTMKLFKIISAIDMFSPSCFFLTSVVVRRRKRSFRVIKPIEIAAPVLPKGIFRVGPTRSCCTSSSLDLPLQSDEHTFPPLLFLTSLDF